MPSLASLRRQVDAIDETVAHALVHRGRLADQIALVKRGAAAPILDEGRERQVASGYAKTLKPAGWSSADLDPLVQAVLRASRERQAGLTVAIQGGPGCWSEESLLSVLPEVRVERFSTFSDARKAAVSGRAGAVWLPVRNSTTGSIADVKGDEVGEPWLEVEYPVCHALLAPPNVPLAAVTRIEAHSEALAQCTATLERLVPWAHRIPTVDGADSAGRLGPGGTTAVLASARIAGRHGLSVLCPSAIDSGGNRTTFCLFVPSVAR